MHTYDRLLKSRTALCVALLVWVGWRVHAVLSLPSLADPREALLLADVARVQRGLAPALFHWPGTPWTFLLAWVTRLPLCDTAAGMLAVSRLAPIPFAATALVVVFRLAGQVTPRALLPTALLATAPGFASGESNLALVDVPMLSLALCSIGIASSGVNGTRRYYGRLAVAGLLLGLASAVKLPAAALAPVLAVIGVGRVTGRRAAAAVCLLAFGATVGGFVLGCPYIVRDVLAEGGGPVLDGLVYELQHYHRGHFGLFATATAPAWTYLTAHAMAAAWCFGFVALVVTVPLAARAAGQRRLGWLWMWVAVSVGALVTHRFSFPRHWLLACPPLFVLASVGTERLAGRWTSAGRAAGALAVVSGAALCVGMNAREAGPSSIERCTEWIQWAEETHGILTEPAAPYPVLAWLYPPRPLPAPPRSAVDARVVAYLVAGVEADVQRAAFTTPRAFREDDFFPLSRERFGDGPAYAEVADTSQYTLASSFGPGSRWWTRVLLLGMRPPFPLNALLQPELRVYMPLDTPLDVAEELRRSD